MENSNFIPPPLPSDESSGFTPPQPTENNAGDFLPPPLPSDESSGFTPPPPPTENNAGDFLPPPIPSEESSGFTPPPTPTENNVGDFLPPPIPSEESSEFTPPEIPNMQYEPGADEKANSATQPIKKKKSVIPFIVIGAVVLIALVTAILLFAFGKDETQKPQDDTTATTVTTTAEAVTQNPEKEEEDVVVCKIGQSYVQYDGFVYFIKLMPDSDGNMRDTICKMRELDGSEFTELYSGDKINSESLYVYNGYIYSGSVKLNLNGEEVGTPDYAEYESLYLDAGCVKIDVEIQNERKTLFYNPQTQCFAELNNVFGVFYPFIETVNTSGDMVMSYLAYDGENVFYSQDGENRGISEIYRVNIATGEKKQIATYAGNGYDAPEEYMTSMKYFDGYIYYLVEMAGREPIYSLYRVRTDASDNTLIADDVYSPDYLIDDGYIYFGNESEFYRAHTPYTRKIKLDGSEREDITGCYGAVVYKDNQYVYRYAYQNEQSYLVRTDLNGQNEEIIIQPLPKPIESENGVYKTFLVNAVVLDGCVYYDVETYLLDGYIENLSECSVYRVNADGTGNRMLCDIKYPGLELETEPETEPSTESEISSDELARTVFEPAFELYGIFCYYNEPPLTGEIIYDDEYGGELYKIDWQKLEKRLKNTFSKRIIDDLMLKAHWYIIDGDYYYTYGGAGGDIEFQYATYSIESQSETKIVYKVKAVYDYGTEDIYYTREKIGGKWLFTNFEMPY